MKLIHIHLIHLQKKPHKVFRGPLSFFAGESQSNQIWPQSPTRAMDLKSIILNLLENWQVVLLPPSDKLEKWSYFRSWKAANNLFWQCFWLCQILHSLDTFLLRLCGVMIIHSAWPASCLHLVLQWGEHAVNKCSLRTYCSIVIYWIFINIHFQFLVWLK